MLWWYTKECMVFFFSLFLLHKCMTFDFNLMVQRFARFNWNGFNDFQQLNILCANKTAATYSTRHIRNIINNKLQAHFFLHATNTHTHTACAAITVYLRGGKTPLWYYLICQLILSSKELIPIQSVWIIINVTFFEIFIKLYNNSDGNERVESALKKE